MERVILLIEDDDIDAEDVRRQLTSRRSGPEVSFQVERVMYLQDGLIRLQDSHYDAVLLDLGLPDGRGLDAIASIHRCKAIPVIILTGRDEERIGVEAMRKGAQDYLVKEQFNAPLLRRVIMFAIERFHYDQRIRENEALIGMMTQQLPAILWSTDENLIFTSSLGARLHELNLMPDEVVGMHLFHYLQTDDPKHPAIEAALKALNGEPSVYELEWHRRIYQTHVEPIYGPEQQIVGMIAVSLDITDHKRLQANFRWAGQIQQGLLPKTHPSIPGYDIAGLCRPAEATGGDYYDYIKMLDGKQAIVIADVSHHGFAPALIMMETRRLVRTLAKQHADISEILRLANQAIYEDTDSDTYVTFFFSVLDPQKRALHYAAAAHIGYHLKPNGSWDRLDSTSIMLGMDSDTTIPCAQPVQLRSGDIVVLLTDGFGDATNKDDQRFTDGRILEFIHVHRHLPARNILSLLLETVQDFCGSAGQFDDMTAVLIKVEE